MCETITPTRCGRFAMTVTRILLLLTALLFAAPHGSAAPHPARAAAAVQVAPPASTQTRSRIIVTVPESDAELVVDGETILGGGTDREFETAPLEIGSTHRYTFTASWQPNTYTTMTRSKAVAFRAGDPVLVDLTVEDPSDRVRVVYVPTPPDIADAMARLAGVTAADVVYEPGCGDARITIAAVQRGAARGVCVDIDPERVTDSRERVEEAGLDDRIEVRLGDALDMPDWSAATVVLLYMGDHFNLLIRPVLWRELPVGARVVSHRFGMGDWTPDQTVSIGSAQGGEYDLLLWTITEDVKRKLVH
jgi:uncharacterized protein (TIGR03000 family)